MDEVLLLKQLCWALPTRYVSEVVNVCEFEGEVMTWGEDAVSFQSVGDAVVRVLRLDLGGGRSCGLRIQGETTVTRVMKEQVIPLPPAFFTLSPATALIVLDGDLMVLLLDPRRFKA